MKKEFLKSFIVYGLGNGLSKFIPILLLPFFTKIFSPEDYGVLEMINTIFLVMSIFGMLQLETSLQRYYYEESEYNNHKIISSIFWSVLLLSSFVSLTMIIFSQYISKIFLNNNFSDLIKISSILVILTNIDILFAIIIRYMKKTILFSVVIFFQTLIISLSSFYFVFTLKLGISGMIYGQILGLSFSIFLFFIIIREKIVFTIEKKLLKKLFTFALPTFPARIGSVLNSHISKFFMLYYLSIYSIGVYSIALKISSSMNILAGAFSLSWIPFIYENYKRDNHKLIYNKIYVYCTIIVMIVVVIFSCFSKEILFLLVKNEDYNKAYHLMGGIAMGIIYTIIKIILDIGPQITKKTKYISYSYFVTSVINILSLLILIRLFEEKGVVMSLIITSISSIIISFYVTQKLYSMPYSKLLLFVTICISLSSVIINMYYDIYFLYKIIFSVVVISLSLIFLYKIDYFKKNSYVKL